MIKRHSLVLPAIALAMVSFGKPKQREVTELKLDDKAVELKADALAAVKTQLRTLCELAEFVSERAPKRAEAAGAG